MRFAKMGVLMSLFLVSALVFGNSNVLAQQRGASLYISPSGGGYNVGETFTVSIYMNSGDYFINAVEANLTFPPDKLQIVSPSTGKSFIDIWVGQPQYSNLNGTISFRGAVPNPGINISKGLISTVTFRVKATGSASIRFADSSKILLNDGFGTDVLSNTSGAVYELSLAPPEGPIVTSPTHPDQTDWSNSKVAIFNWDTDLPSDGYSFILDEDPSTIPDDITDRQTKEVSYENLIDGTSYFHIKANRAGKWGGVTHYAINVDTSPPAKFNVEIEPSSRTSVTRPVIHFGTTDAQSSLDHYEIKIAPLSIEASSLIQNTDIKEFFVETSSPYVPELAQGKYMVIVRAYDQANNFIEVTENLHILPQSLQVLAFITPTAWWHWLILLLILVSSAYIARRSRLWHRGVATRMREGVMSDQEIEGKLRELQNYQKKYGHLILIFALVFTLFAGVPSVKAQGISVDPPIITTISENISNKELLYVGGKGNIIGSDITVYIQNEITGETSSYTTFVDKRGDWFYSHEGFLTPGKYLIWVQAQVGNTQSPPSGQYVVDVNPTAISIGSSRITYETLYMTLTGLFGAATLAFLINAIYHYYHGRRKYLVLVKEIREAEESIRRGFALIRKDIKAELEVISRVKMDKELREDELEKEKKLLTDLDFIEANIGKEVWDIRENL